MASREMDMTVPASKLNESVTVNVRVTGLRVFHARWWMAAQLMRLAALIAGCGLSIDVEHR